MEIWTPEQQLPGFVSKKEDEGGNNKARKYLTCCQRCEKGEKVGSGSGRKWGRRNSMLAFFHVIRHEDVCCINILWGRFQ